MADRLVARQVQVTAQPAARADARDRCAGHRGRAHTPARAACDPYSPRTAAWTGRMASIMSANIAKSSCCSASDNASSGVGWTSTMTAVGADGDAAQGHRPHQRALAGPVARVDHDRQVGQLAEERDRGQVERVAGVRLEGPDAALAQDHVRVARAEDVLGGHQPLLDRRAKAALEQDRPGDPPDVAQERVVLHVAGADLEHVDVLGDELDLAGSMTSVTTGSPVRSRASARKRRPSTPRPWNAYGRGARLERAAADDRGAGRLDRVSRVEQLLAALDRARPGHHRERAVADDRVEDRDDRVLGVELARGQLERAGDRGDALDAGQRAETLEQGRPARADLADDGDRRPLGADVIERRQALGEDLALDAEDLGLGGADGHHHEHRVGVSSVGRPAQTKKQRSRLCLVCPARPVPRGLSDLGASCRASKVEGVAHVRARTVSSGAPAVNATRSRPPRPWPAG